FLEGGAAWACSLYADLVGHWEKRNGEAIHALDPARLDRRLMLDLIAEYGEPAMTADPARLRAYVEQDYPRPAVLDEFAACGIGRVEDFRERFVDRFFFGCEADSPTNV